MEEKQAIQALAALAQESRLRVFRLLVSSGTRGLPAGRIAAELGIPAATLSFHLKELARAALIVDRRAGRSIIYSLNVAGMRSLLAFLSEDCCEGRPELCQPGVLEGLTADECCPKPGRVVKRRVTRSRQRR
jgi:DNA-binding transcriptional ArsR family regulator